MILLLTALFFSIELQPVEFPSTDRLMITGDLYMAHEEAAPFIVLFHQAGFSRGEYRELAPKLNKLGFNCLAIDQRSGEGVNGINNETATRAKEKNLPHTYLDAMIDLEAAVEFVRGKKAKGKLIVWGSSYSAALVLYLAGEKPEFADGVLAFSPGEYFERDGKTADYIQQRAAKIKVPVFITSALNEKTYWADIFKLISAEKEWFLPSSKGIHGSRALWESTPEHPVYWEAVKKFLERFTPK